MKLRYKIAYEYDYAKNSVLIILQSQYFQKEYRCANIGNLPAILSTALADFNEMHKYKIEELENEETVKNAQRKKSSSKEFGKE